MNPNWMPGVAVLMGLSLAAPAVATAQTREIYENPDYRYRTGARGVGFDKGYEDGLKRGRHDGDHRDRYNPARDEKYREGDHGYRSSYGARYDYVRGYRLGFEQGYRDGYAGYDYAYRGTNGRYGDRYYSDRFYR